MSAIDDKGTDKEESPRESAGAPIEKAVAKGEDPWHALPDDVKNGIENWFRPLPDEQFLTYHPDSDVAGADVGAGGMIVTTKRIAVCHDRHVDDISLLEGGELFLEKNGLSYNVIYRHGRRGHHQRQLLRIPGEDADPLIHALGELKLRLRVTRG